MKRGRSADDRNMNNGHTLTPEGDACKVHKTSCEQNPSGTKDIEINGGSGKQRMNGGTQGGSPLQPVAVNEGPACHQEAPQPSAKEAAAAKAARIRLGLEKDDGTLAAVDAVAPKLPSGVERKVDVEYVATGDLKPLDNARKAAEGVLDALASKDWVAQCEALNLTRQLAVHHKKDCEPLLNKIIPAVVKLVKSLRSSVCKTAMMCCTDMFTVFKEAVVDLLDVGGPTRPASSLLCQLLLRAANDKQFVVEETQRTLAVLSASIPPTIGAERAVAYAKHRNPKVRGKAAVLLAAFVARMGGPEVRGYGLEELLVVASGLVTDNTPDAREGARRLLALVKGAFLEGRGAKGDQEEEEEEEEEGEEEEREPKRTPWQHLCLSVLGAGKAQAVLKACK